jgi:UTP--glucose-1-phosphate uridylyltransferase
VILDEIDPGSRAMLEQHGFDEAQFEELRRRLADGTLTAVGNVVQGIVEPPLPSDLLPLPEPGDPGYAEAQAAGVDRLKAGTVAMVVLAGGMATRFGGGVKAVAEAIDGRSFLEVKLGETARLGKALGVEVPVAVMTSFATDQIVRAHVAEKGLGDPFWFCQTAAPRVRPDASVFLEDGKASLYGPGHGDVLATIKSSGTLAELQRRGVRTIVVSNVDNLGARLDPVVVGMHALAGTPLTVEVVAKGDDTGGAPARVDGHPQLLEAMRFPPEFDQGRIPVFNTNTSLIEADALAEPIELTWLVVEKTVDDQPVVQFERLYHELSAHVPTTFLVVPRHGPRGRFLPVKEPDDLAEVQPRLRELLATPLPGLGGGA